MIWAEQSARAQAHPVVLSYRENSPLSREILEAAIHRQQARGCHETALSFIIDNSAHAGDECLSWPFSRFHTGYGKVGVVGRIMFAHRVMCVAAHGTPPTDQHDAAHTCGMGHEGCINPKHLRWATHAENSADKIAHGTLLSGTRHYQAKLTAEQVAVVRAADLTAWGSTQRLAESLGVTNGIICRIRNHNSYRGV